MNIKLGNDRKCELWERIYNKTFLGWGCLSELLFVRGWGVSAVGEQAVSSTQEVFQCVVFQVALVNPHLVKFSNVSIAHILKPEKQEWN